MHFALQAHVHCVAYTYTHVIYSRRTESFKTTHASRTPVAHVSFSLCLSLFLSRSPSFALRPHSSQQIVQYTITISIDHDHHHHHGTATAGIVVVANSTQLFLKCICQLAHQPLRERPRACVRLIAKNLRDRKEISLTYNVFVYDDDGNGDNGDNSNSNASRHIHMHILCVCSAVLNI